MCRWRDAGLKNLRKQSLNFTAVFTFHIPFFNSDPINVHNIYQALFVNLLLQDTFDSSFRLFIEILKQDRFPQLIKFYQETLHAFNFQIVV